MSKLITEFYNGQDIYDDGDIESDLLDYYQNPDSQVDIHDDKYFYFTTNTRQNILNWYPFQKTDTILEIGSGCGTLTGMLCQKAQQVVAIEGSKRRAEITHFRHQDQDNLTVYAGDFTDISLDQQFDYIVMIGVFEYANQFFPHKDNPFDFFLDQLKPFLKPTSKVLVAIENRYGIKYWAGCNEDHIVKPYVGLEGYETSKICRTFGKTELINLLDNHQFTNTKFYYPFPDYKLPNIIFSDDRLPKAEEIQDIPIYPYNNRINFNIHDVLRGISDNQMFGFFANSFLVEFGGPSSQPSSAIYAKILNYRNLEYQTITTEYADHQITKSAVSPAAIPHLQSIAHNHLVLNRAKIPACSATFKTDQLNIQYIKGISPCTTLLSLAKQHDYAKIEQLLDNLVKFYHSISRRKQFKNPIHPKLAKIYPDNTYILKISTIDGNISNLILDGHDRYTFIDQEWISDKELPADYLIYFSVRYFGRYTTLVDQGFIKKYLKKHNITSAKQKLFLQIEQAYYQQNSVVDTKLQATLDGCASYIYTDMAPQAPPPPPPAPPAPPAPAPAEPPAAPTPPPSLFTRAKNKGKRIIKRLIGRS